MVSVPVFIWGSTAHAGPSQVLVKLRKLMVWTESLKKLAEKNGTKIQV